MHAKNIKVIACVVGARASLILFQNYIADSLLIKPFDAAPYAKLDFMYSTVVDSNSNNKP